jgi:hypothetical protein
LLLLCCLLLLPCCCRHRLRKAVDYWKEQAGLITADAKTAADLFDVENRRCDSPAPSEGMGGMGMGGVGVSSFSTPPSAIPSGLGSASSSRPGTGFSRGVGSAIALQLQAAATDAAAALGGGEGEADAGTEAGSIAGEQQEGSGAALPSSRSTGSASDAEL